MLPAEPARVSAFELPRPLEPRTESESTRDQLSRDLVLYYPFDHDTDGEVYDESDNGNNGVTVGAVEYEDSFRGRAARFASNRTYIQSDAAGLNMHGWKQATISVWIKTKKVTTYAELISRGEVTGETTGGITMRAGSDLSKAAFSFRRQFQSNPPSDERLFSSSLQPRNMDRIDRWLHLVGTFDGKFLRFYINGQLDREAECTSDGLHLWDRPENKLVIGNASSKSRMAWTDKYFDGLVDEVRIWKRGLSAADVMAIYRQNAELAETLQDE